MGNPPIEMRIYVYSPQELQIGIDSGNREVIADFIDPATGYIVCGHVSRYDLAKLAEWEW